MRAAELREKILRAQDTARELVEVPEWGCSVYVAVMSGHARDAWEASMIDAKGEPVLADYSAKLAAATIVDEAGKPVFSTADIAALSAKNSAVLKRVVAVARRLNRLGTDAVEDAKGN